MTGVTGGEMDQPRQADPEDHGDGGDEKLPLADKTKHGNKEVARTIRGSHRTLLIGPGAGVRPTIRSPEEGARPSKRLYHGDV